MKREVTFIHAADLHLDSPFNGLANVATTVFEEIKESTFIALNRLVKAAIEKQVDFVLITGDLFDNEKQSLKAQVRLRRAFEHLQAENIAVYLSYGNHDYITGNQHKVTYPDNVHIFPDENVRTFIHEKAGIPLASIAGFSYVNREVTANKTAEYTIEGIQTPFHIAMLHGSVQGNTDHDTYAPFLLSQLTSKGFDYWALGHIHQQMILNKDPYVVYPGNIQGRHRKETGEKGCYFVRLSATKTELEFIQLHHIEFTESELDISECNDLFELENKILTRLQEIEGDSAQLVDLKLHSKRELLRDWQQTGRLDELLEIINEKIEQKQPWQFVFRQKIIVEAKVEQEAELYGEHFLGELQRRFIAGDRSSYLEELYHHRQARKYLALPTKKEEKIYQQQAKDRLMNRLGKEHSHEN